jgi:hypothetical protein
VPLPNLNWLVCLDHRHTGSNIAGKDETLGLVSVSRIKAPRLSVSSRSNSNFDD